MKRLGQSGRYYSPGRSEGSKEWAMELSTLGAMGGAGAIVLSVAISTVAIAFRAGKVIKSQEQCNARLDPLEKSVGELAQGMARVESTVTSLDQRTKRIERFINHTGEEES